MPRPNPRNKKKLKPAVTGGLHPNPQFARPGWQSLNGPWDFAIDRDGVWSDPTQIKWSAQHINVPFAPETPASGIEDTGFMAACWYRRAFAAPRLKPSGRLILRFGAVEYRATVWVNGRIVAFHEGGYTPFHADITDALADEGDQVLVVRAEDDPHDLAKPRGKQDWQRDPHSIWYPRTTGIWQSVWLEPVGASWLERVAWQPNLERFDIDLWAYVARPTQGLRLRTVLRVGERLLADDVYAVVSGEVHRAISISDPGIDDYRNEWLWSPHRPVLIAAELELVDEDGDVLDSVRSYTAMRSVAIVGDRFTLNGRPQYLRLVLDQGYWPQSGLTPPDDEAVRRDVELAKAMGFNGVRAHQRIADPRYLYWADVLGLFVWAEMPSAYRFTPEAVRRLTQQWHEAIERDRSHPCIIVWVPMNESWGVPDLPSNAAHRHTVRTLYHLTKSLDMTRPVVGNDGWEMEVTDIVAIHDYDASAQRIGERYSNRHEPQPMLAREWPGHRTLLLDKAAYHGQPIMLTEFGGIALREANTWGYSQAGNPEELASRYRALLRAVNDLPLFAGFCYTQFADTYQEANGLLRADRTPKVPLQHIAAATTGISQ